LFFSGDKEKVPEEVMLKSELSYMQEEMERLKHKHQQNLTEQARQQQEIHQLTMENTGLRQQLLRKRPSTEMLLPVSKTSALSLSKRTAS